MTFKVTVPLLLVPGSTTFSDIGTAEIRLHQYGWKTVAFDSGPVGKIVVEETRPIHFFVAGKPGATAETAQKDVTDAIRNVGLFGRVKGVITSGVDKADKFVSEQVQKAADAAGSAAGKAAGGFASGIGLPGGGTALLIGVAIFGLAAIAVGIVAVKRG